MNSKIPLLLSPYLSLPAETSLILLTSVLGASTNWLLLRYIHSYLRTPSTPPSLENEGEGLETKVVLVSFLRDLPFWRENARKLGLDLDKLGAKEKFGFVDGLTGLFINAKPAQGKDDSGWQAVLRVPELKAIALEIQKMVQGMQHGKANVVLIVDGLDFFLAAKPNGCDAAGVGDMVMGLRENVHSIVLALSDDDPLVKRQVTELETNHAAFLLGIAHQADLTMSLRLLDTGTARDVSGIVRISSRENIDIDDGIPKLEERELLYLVGRDGTVKVFERGQ